MKILSLAVLSLFAFSAQSADVFDALAQYQASLTPEAGAAPSTPSRPTAGVSNSASSSSVTNANCEGGPQNSIPLKVVTSLILKKDAALDVNHEASSGTLRVSSSAPMIGNCNSMLNWSLRTNEIEGKKTYSVEVKFKDGEDCPAEMQAGDKKCFRVAKMVDGSVTFESKPFNKSLDGFKACLTESGAVSAAGAVVPASIYRQPVQQTFTGLEESGNLYFFSQGPFSSSESSRSRFGMVLANGCDIYEKIHPTITAVYSSSELETQRLNAEADRLRECPISEYQRVADFVDRYQSYADQLGGVRDHLILEAAKKAVTAINAGTQTEDDLKVIADFERYIINPRKQRIEDLANSMESLQGEELQAARTEMKRLQDELLTFAKTPYFQPGLTEKLISKGLFGDAEKMEGIRITIDQYTRIGKREGNVLVTPEVAQTRITQAKTKLADQLVTARENYDVRTGVTTGMSDTYKNLALAMRRNVQRRTENYTREIYAEYARVQQGGYCYAYFRNTQKCIQDSLQRIQELQVALQSYNKTDTDRAVEFDQKATQYAALELEGRRYVASQNGEPVPTETAAVIDTTLPAARPQDNAAMNPQMNPQMNGQMGQMGQQSMMPAWMMNQTSPYGNTGMMQQQQNPYGQMYGQQPSYLGQSGFNAQFGYQGTMGSNFMGQQQPQMGALGMNWLSMGQGSFGGQQQMYGQSPTPYYSTGFGQQQPQFGASPYGQMYGQSPYLAGGMGQQPSWMGQGMGYPNLYGR